MPGTKACSPTFVTFHQPHIPPQPTATRDRRAFSQGVGVPSPLLLHLHLHSHLCTSNWLETDALPLFWEIFSGGGEICGASIHQEWKQFQYLFFLLEANRFMTIKCSLPMPSIWFIHWILRGCDQMVCTHKSRKALLSYLNYPQFWGNMN